VVNAPGTGLADDKLVHGYVDDLVRFYRDEGPLLPSVPSRPAAELEDLSGQVVKPWRRAARPRTPGCCADRKMTLRLSPPAAG